MDAGLMQRLSARLDEADAFAEPADRERWLASLPADESEHLRRMLGSAGGEAAARLDRGPAFEPPALDRSTLVAGRHFGPYQLLRPLGEGGMGEVWLAESDGPLKRAVALKLPLVGPRRELLFQRFARERDILGALVHPHIARLYDAGFADDGQPWLALEYVDGVPIDRYCSERNLPVQERVALVRQLADAVQTAHGSLFVHRDIKPGNVLVTPDGRAVLLDFGIAKLLEDAHTGSDASELTRLGGRALSQRYAAPEQWLGTAVSTATDVWGLGVLLYQLLADRLPFDQPTSGALEAAVLEADPPRLDRLPNAPARRLPRSRATELETIVGRALKKRPEDRYRTVAALDEDLRRWLAGEPVLAHADSAWYRARKFVGRHRAPVAVAGVALTAVLVATGVALSQARRAEAQARIAQAEARTAQAVQGFMQGIFGANTRQQSDPQRARRRTAAELLEEGAARVVTGLADAPEAKAAVLKTLADMHVQMGLHGKAAALKAERAALVERLRGEGHPEHIRALIDWADENVNREQATAVLERAERLFERLRAPEPLLRAELDVVQVSLARAKGRPGDMLMRAERATGILRQGPPSRLLLAAMNHLGSALREALRFDDAHAVLVEGLTIADGLTDVDHERVDLLGTLSMVEGLLGRPDAAIARGREAVTVSERLNGPQSEDVALRLISLGGGLARQGRYAEGLAELQRGRAIVESWPADSSERADLWPEFAGVEAAVLTMLGRPEEALAMLERSRAVTQQVADRPYVAWAWHAYRAKVWIDLGQHEQAAAELAAARRIATEHQLLVSVQAYMRHLEAEHLVRSAQPGAAAAVERALQDPSLSAVQARSVRTMRVELDLAEGRCEAAATAAAELLAGPRVAGDDRVQARLQQARGSALACLKRPAEALPPLRDAVADWQRLEPSDSGLGVAGARLALADALLQQGAMAEARSLHAQAAAAIARHPRVDAALAAQLRRQADRLRS